VGGWLVGVSPLAFAIGVYLPLATMAAIYLGGCMRALCEKRAGGSPSPGGDPGVLAASGLVAGEGLAGVLVAALVAGNVAPRALPPRLAGIAGELTALALVLLVCAFVYRAGTARARAAA
jgi:hypothetical protein